jgi:hypothetical protein
MTGSAVERLVAKLVVSCLLVTTFLLFGRQISAGPLRYGAEEGGSSAQCASTDVGESILFGDHFRSNGVITIDQVEAVGVDGLEYLDVWLLPPGGIGSSMYPPENYPKWDDRRAAIGAEVQPDQDVNVVIRVARTGTEPGTIERLVIHYTSGGIHFRKPGTQSYELRQSCA